MKKTVRGGGPCSPFFDRKALQCFRALLWFASPFTTPLEFRLVTRQHQLVVSIENLHFRKVMDQQESSLTRKSLWYRPWSSLWHLWTSQWCNVALFLIYASIYKGVRFCHLFEKLIIYIILDIFSNSWIFSYQLFFHLYLQNIFWCN